MGNYESQEKYDKANTIIFSMKLNTKTEKDIIDKLNSVEKKRTYIKNLIRADIARGGK